jgi:hypothetical protein
MYVCVYMCVYMYVCFFILVSPCAILIKYVSQSCNNTQLCAKVLKFLKSFYVLFYNLNNLLHIIVCYCRIVIRILCMCVYIYMCVCMCVCVCACVRFGEGQF